MTKGERTSSKKMADKPEVLDAVLKETVDLVTVSRIFKNKFFLMFLSLDSFSYLGLGYVCRKTFRLKKFLRI